MLNFQDLPDELVLKILSNSESKDLITYGQVSKRIRKISHDDRLWVTANLVKKIVKTELLEIMLIRCKILNLSNSTIVGSLSSNLKSQIRSLDLSQSALTGTWHCEAYSTENIELLEELLFSCCSLQHLKMEGLLVTPKMTRGICKNGKTLQILHLNNSCVIEFNIRLASLLSGNLQAIIKCCQELKELAFVNGNKWIHADDLAFLATQISPNIVQLNLSNHYVNDDYIEILLIRCNKIKVLNLKATLITNNSLKTMRKYLNLTLEELSLTYNVYEPFPSEDELKSMPRLKILNLYSKKEDEKEIQNLRQHLPDLMIRTFFDC